MLDDISYTSCLPRLHEVEYSFPHTCTLGTYDFSGLYLDLLKFEANVNKKFQIDIFTNFPVHVYVHVVNVRLCRCYCTTDDRTDTEEEASSHIYVYVQCQNTSEYRKMRSFKNPKFEQNDNNISLFV